VGLLPAHTSSGRLALTPLARHESYGNCCLLTARAFEIDPNYLVTLYLAGGVYSRMGRHDEALPVVTKWTSSSGTR